MNKEMSWVLGYLLSDGCIARPKYRKKGDESHLSFSCKYSDREVLFKVKKILQTKANITDYPEYKSPNSKLRVYDKKDLLEKYSNIKTTIPIEDINGFERHFIRGLWDGDGTISIRNRNGFKTFRVSFIDIEESITKWVARTICSKLCLPYKEPRFSPQNNVWEIQWEGNVAGIIAWWLYHGDVSSCCLQRKKDKYDNEIIDGKTFKSNDDEILYISRAVIEDDWIKFSVPSSNTLKWCHIVQHLISFKTQPVFKNPGKRKYYNLYIPNQLANMRGAS